MILIVGEVSEKALPFRLCMCHTCMYVYIYIYIDCPVLSLLHPDELSKCVLLQIQFANGKREKNTFLINEPSSSLANVLDACRPRKRTPAMPAMAATAAIHKDVIKRSYFATSSFCKNAGRTSQSQT